MWIEYHELVQIKVTDGHNLGNRVLRNGGEDRIVGERGGGGGGGAHSTKITPFAPASCSSSTIFPLGSRHFPCAATVGKLVKT